MKIIETILKSHKELNSNSKEFYKDYWSLSNVVKETTILKNKMLYDVFFPEKLSNKNIVEIGIGGEGGIINQLKDINNVIGIDVSETAIVNCKKMGINVLLKDISKEFLNYQGEIDVIFAFEVFEHLTNPQFAIENIKNALKDDGILIISIPNLTTHHWPRLFYPELFEREAFYDFLIVNGFDVRNVDDIIQADNVYANFTIEPYKKKYSNYFYATKINQNDSEKNFCNAMHLWNKKDSNMIRVKAVDAIDLFRKSYFANKNNYAAKLFLTLSLTYRYLMNEQEEFNRFFNEIKEELPIIIKENNANKYLDYILFFIKFNLEIKFLTNHNYFEENELKIFYEVLKKMNYNHTNILR